MKFKGNKEKMNRHASMDLSGFDATEDAFGADDYLDENDRAYNPDDAATPVVSPESAPAPELNLAAIREMLENNGSGDSSSPDAGDNGNGNGSRFGDADFYDRTDSSRSIKAEADHDLASPSSQSSAGKKTRFSVVKKTSKAKRRASEASGYTDTLSSVGSSSQGSSLTSGNIWSKLLVSTNATLWNGSGFEDDDDDDSVNGALPSCGQAVKTWGRGTYYESKHFAKTCIKNPLIIVWSLLAFGVVFGTGLGIVIAQKDAAIARSQHTARFVATEMGDWFAAEFRRAMQPLYAVQQAVLFSGLFDELPAQIGPYPSRVYEAIDPKTNATKIMRNVSNICNDEVQKKFASIVEPINNDARLDGIVVGYRLYAGNVMCTAHPMINTKDFPDGPPLDHNKFLGYDAGHDQSPFWKATVEDMFVDRNPNMNIFGPFTNPVLPEAFCGHLPVWIPPGPDADPEDISVVLDVQGVPVTNAFGFVMNFLHWQNLKNKSNIYERFADCGLEFCLTRDDGLDKGIKTIAESESCSLLDDSNSIIVTTDTTANGLWDNRVGTISPNGWTPTWYPWAIFAVTVASLIIGLLTAIVLVEKQLHRNLLYKVMPKKAIKKLHRGQTVLEKFNLVTIFFSDIVGFTNMCGEMRPIQVMRMLNELYTELDKLVAKHKVYKVETIGDAYMVVGGAPDRCSAPDAAERVAAFALEAIAFVKTFRTKNGDRIFIRAGLASGPVVAGVVGDAMPRYCFFGDTVNFASRMESTSSSMKIQCSELTYRLLLDAPSKAFTLKRRMENGKVGVEVKGKGHQTTYWVQDANVRSSNPSKLVTNYPNGDVESPENIYAPGVVPTIRELDNSNSTVVSDGSMVSSVAGAALFKALTSQVWTEIGSAKNSVAAATSNTDDNIERIACILEHHLERCVQQRGDPELSSTSKSKIRSYVAAIESTYSDVHFHSFQHATHVVLSMNKLIHSLQEDISNADPLTGFSLVFAALVHDAGHTGKSNKILMEQDHPLAKRYDGAKVPIAEKHSIDIALDILFRDEYKPLRTSMVPTEVDKLHFSKVIFQSVLVTDIATSDRVKLGIKRFEIASGPALGNKFCDCIVCQKTDSHSDSTYEGLCPLFSHLENVMSGVDLPDDVMDRYPGEFVVTHCGLKKCVSNEHMMQAADVAHLMQSWEVFTKWNFRLYKELMDCHSKGLCPDPTDGWFQGQIGFIEHYILPLARRTQEFFEEDFGEDVIRAAECNLQMWKEYGEQASNIMVNGVKTNKDEKFVLDAVHNLPSCPREKSLRRSSMEPLLFGDD